MIVKKIQVVLTFCFEKLGEVEKPIARIKGEKGTAEYLIDTRAGFTPTDRETWMCEVGKDLFFGSTGEGMVDRRACFPLYRMGETLVLEFEMADVRGHRELQSATFDETGNKTVWKPMATSAVFQPQDGERWECLSGRVVFESRDSRGRFQIRECQPVSRLDVPHVTVGKQDAPLGSVMEITASARRNGNGHKPAHRDPTSREQRRGNVGFELRSLRNTSASEAAARQ